MAQQLPLSGTLVGAASARPAGRPLVISASRRTDLPGFYPDACARLIRTKIARLRTRTLYGVVFWSRHVTPFLSGGPLFDLVHNELDNPFLNLTVTGLGGSELEPGVPATEKLLPNLMALVKVFKGDGFRIRWRFDPLLPQKMRVTRFEQIAVAMVDAGIQHCVTSLLSPRNLQGAMAARYQACGVCPSTDNEVLSFLEKVLNVAKRRGVELHSCATPRLSRLVPANRPAACISKTLLERGHPFGEPLELPRDWSQRKACLCVESEDIGDYDAHPCLGGCGYCYSRAGGPDGRIRGLASGMEGLYFEQK